MNIKNSLIASALMAIACISCKNDKTENWMDHSVDVASQQLLATAEKMDGTGVLPRSIWTVYPLDFVERQTERDRKTFADSLVLPADSLVNKMHTINIYDWTSGFFPGSLWYAYELTGNEDLRESKDKKFLDQAINVANMIMSRVKTEDCIPYWDYDAPVTDETPRDASAAAVTASAFLELCSYAPDGKKYSDYAEKILRSLSSESYLAKPGENMGFVLMHSTGSLPNDSEIDTPLNYADYYYLEALVRYKELKK